MLLSHGKPSSHCCSVHVRSSLQRVSTSIRHLSYVGVTYWDLCRVPVSLHCSSYMATSCVQGRDCPETMIDLQLVRMSSALLKDAIGLTCLP